MITYNPFWDTLKRRKVSLYELIMKHNVSSNTIARIRVNKPMTTQTLDTLCNILNCDVSDILSYERDPKE